MPKFNQRIKILLFLPLLLGSIFLLFKYSRAQFSDSETVLGNSIQVGVWGGETTPTPPETEPTPTPTEEIPLPTATSTPIPGNLADHVVISEVQVAGGTADDEFIELYNPTASDVNISGWSIQYRGGGAASYNKRNFESGTVPAHGFFLITKGGSDGYDGTITSNMSQSTFSLSATGGTVFLVNNQTELAEGADGGPNVVDKLAYGTGTLRPEGGAYTPAPSANKSLERRAYSTSDATSMMSGLDVTKGNAYDSENNASDFVLRTTSEPQNTSSTTETP